VRKRLRVVDPDCAGVDVGKGKHSIAVDPARYEDPVRNFGSFTGDWQVMADWLAECGVKIVAMESTGMYWIPLYEVLDRMGFEVQLLNPRATQYVSSRKSDALDCA
jgi:transposase